MNNEQKVSLFNSDGTARTNDEIRNEAARILAQSSKTVPTAEDALFELRESATSDRSYMSPEGFNAAIAKVKSDAVASVLSHIAHTIDNAPPERPHMVKRAHVVEVLYNEADLYRSGKKVVSSD